MYFLLDQLLYSLDPLDPPIALLIDQLLYTIDITDETATPIPIGKAKAGAPKATAPTTTDCIAIEAPVATDCSTTVFICSDELSPVAQ